MPTERKSGFQNALKRTFSEEGFANIILPIAGIIESIASKGQSPGVAATQQRQLMLNDIQRREERTQADFERKQNELQNQNIIKSQNLDLESKQRASDREKGYLAEQEKIRQVAQSPSITPDMVSSMEYNAAQKYQPEKAAEMQFNKVDIPKTEYFDKVKRNDALIQPAYESLKEMESSGYDPSLIKQLRASIQNSPTGAADFFQRLQSGQLGTAESVRKITAETPAKIQQASAMIPVSAQGAAATSIARTGAESATGSLEKEQSLRKEYAQVSKPFTDTKDAYNRIQTAIQEPSAAGDVSLIYQYMKMLDPGSTVREGEAAMAQQATGIPNQVLNAYNKAVSGQRLNDNQRKDFINQAEKIYIAKAKSQKNTESKYIDIAKKWNVEPSNVLAGISVVIPQQNNKAKVGGKLMIDKNGNRAMVYPDGSFEEVK